MAVGVPSPTWRVCVCVCVQELEYALQDSGASVFIADAERFKRAKPHIASLGLSKRCIVVCVPAPRLTARTRVTCAWGRRCVPATWTWAAN